jgi:hypothetical protein
MKGCDGSKAPELTTNDGNDIGVCPQSALWAMQWQDHLNRARHYAFTWGMPLRQEAFDETAEDDGKKKFGFPTLGYGFWRKMIYMSKFTKDTNKFKWWKHMEDGAGVVRLPCGCTMREYCPGRKETLPFVDGVSMRRLGAHPHPFIILAFRLCADVHLFSYRYAARPRVRFDRQL